MLRISGYFVTSSNTAEGSPIFLLPPSGCSSIVKAPLHHVLLFLDATSPQAVDPQIKRSYGVSQYYGDCWRFSPELRSDNS